MRKLFVVTLFAFMFIGCASQPAVYPVIETPHKKTAPLTETITTVKGATLDANGKLVGGVVDQTKTEINPRMAELILKQALIQQQAQSVVAVDAACSGSFPPSYCYAGVTYGSGGGGYNTTFHSRGGAIRPNSQSQPAADSLQAICKNNGSC